MSFSRRPGERHNRGRIATAGGSGGASNISAPSDADEGEDLLVVYTGPDVGALELRDVSSDPDTDIATGVVDPWEVTYSDVTPGTRQLQFFLDGTDTPASGIASVAVAPQAPTLTSPAAGNITIGDTVTYTATGTADGFDANTTQIEFYDGATLRATDSAAPWTQNYDSTGHTEGSADQTAKRYWEGLAGETGTIDSAGVSVNWEESGAITPLTLWPAEVLVWRRGDTVTQTGGLVDSWPDLSGNGYHANVQTGGERPVYNASAASLANLPTVETDGVATFWRNNAVPLPAPATTNYTRVMIMRFKTFPGTARGFLSQTASTSNRGELRSATSPNVAMSNGATVNSTAGSTVNWQVIIATFTGSVSDVMQIGAVQTTGASALNNSGTGEIGGKNAGTGTSFTALECAETFIKTGTWGATELAQLQSYLDEYYAGVGFDVIP